MNQRGDRFVAAAVSVALFTLAPALGAAQEAEDGALPRTPWGHPVIQGIWTSSTYTPLERPDNLADQAELSEEELAELNTLLTADGVDPLRARSVLAAETEAERLERMRQTQENIHYDNSIWLREPQPRRLTTRRTSLIVDPPDGRIPAARPVRPGARGAAQGREPLARPEHRPAVVRQPRDPHAPGALPGVAPRGAADAAALLQRPHADPPDPGLRGHHAGDAGRTTPASFRSTARPHLPPSMREWSGDSRGRWEGDTLVVESTNFNEKVHFHGSSTGLHVVERFTRLDDQTIRYEFTVEDPTTWTRPWSVEYPLMKREGPLYEYACHEGNHDARHILEVARNLDAARAAEARSSGGTGSRR